MRQEQALRQLWAAIFVVLAAILAPLPSAQVGDLRVVAEGVRSALGNVIFALHHEGDPYPDKDSPFVGGFRRATVGTVGLTFGDLLAGRYALVAVHDENLNQELDINRLGVPTEGSAFPTTRSDCLSRRALPMLRLKSKRMERLPNPSV
jgi:uncharacterized protein (DUF2141 family)